MDQTAVFEAERARLARIAERVLDDPAEAQDLVQQAWLRLHATETDIDNLPGWLTTVTTRLCLDRLRQRMPVPEADIDLRETSADPADEVALADTVGVALQVVLERLTPSERVAFVLHDSFGVDFPTIAEILGTTPAAARKLASRARSKVSQPAAGDHQPDWEIVDAFLAAAREGDFARLMHLLAPDAVVVGDEAAIIAGTPARIDGRREVATMFNGAAKAALSVFIGDRPGAAWFHLGQAHVAFDFTITGGLVQRIDFRADPQTLAQIVRRTGHARRAEPQSHLSCGGNGTRTLRRSHILGSDRHTDSRPSAGLHIRPRGPETMKTMTCQQLGGPCELALRGETADQLIKAQDRHLKDSAQNGDATHEQASREMKGRWKRPRQSMGWYLATKKAFAQLPED